MKQIEHNDFVRVTLYDKTDSIYELQVDDVALKIVLKKWIIKHLNDEWVVINYQPSEQDYFKYEFVEYPIKFNSFEDLINTFQELTNNFTYFFNFPKQ